jgi:hypothetical protein
MKRNRYRALTLIAVPPGVSHSKKCKEQAQECTPADVTEESDQVVDPLRQQWNKHAFFLTETELTQLCFDMHKKRATGDDLLMAITNCTATQSIMPYMVKNAQSIASEGNALSNDLLYDLHKKETFNKLNNFLEMVSCTSAEDCTIADIMSPACMYRDLAAVVLIACGPTLVVALRGDGRVQEDDLFALPTVTLKQQARAQAWIATYWVEKGNQLARWGAVMPSFNTPQWWKFVGRFMRNILGFGIEKKWHRKGVSAATRYKLVANGFWKVHGIDAVQVGLAHRLRTRKRQNSVTVPILHNDRPYGVLAKRRRKCNRCPSNRPATQSVRQNGTEWLCSSLDRFNRNTVGMLLTAAYVDSTDCYGCQQC